VNVFQIVGSGPSVAFRQQRDKYLVLRDNGSFKTIPVAFKRKPEQSQLQAAHIIGQFPVDGQIKKDLMKLNIGFMKISIFSFVDGLFHGSIETFHPIDLIFRDLIEYRKNHLRLECPDNFKEIQKVFIHQDIDPHATLGQDGHQTLNLQLGERLAQGCTADIQLLGQFAYINQGARSQGSTFDLIAEISKDFLAKAPSILSCDWWHTLNDS